MMNMAKNYLLKFEDLYMQHQLAYQINHVVADPATGKWYKLLVNYAANTAATSLALTTWLETSTNASPTFADAYVPEFNINQSYAMDRIVAYQGKLYVAVANQVAPLLIADLADPTKWKDFNSASVLPATTAEAIGGILNSVYISPLTLQDVLIDASSQATTVKQGTIRTSTDVEAYAESDTGISLTPGNLSAMTASNTEMRNALELKKFATPASCLDAYGFKDPVTKNANVTLLEDEHLTFIGTAGITVTLPPAATIDKSKLNTVSHRIINISGGNATVSGGTPALTPVTKTLDSTNISAGTIPTIVGGALI